MIVKLYFFTKEKCTEEIYDVPQSLLRLLEYSLRLRSVTSKDKIKEEVKNSFLNLDWVKVKIKNIERRNHTKVFVEVKE